MTVVWFFVGLFSVSVIGFRDTAIFWFLGNMAAHIAEAMEDPEP